MMEIPLPLVKFFLTYQMAFYTSPIKKKFLSIILVSCVELDNSINTGACVMTFEAKEKCADLWKMASGDDIPASYWHESAGNMLASFFTANYSCSKAMSFVPRPK
ncbi:MAG TPA: hypothetical protein PLB14_10360 [Smithellaceae bacterium]|jgi:hypothetical protein|nr:hypothetical protein [Syntrophaceae bacterium]HPV50102.1 hypothetical protein [Smithellaceae bacterium]